jgi:CheY-like chemotaxis protein
MLDAQPDMRLVGEADNGEDAVALHAELRPDVVLMDLQLPRMDGVEATRLIREADPQARVIVLTTYNGDYRAVRALQAGAGGYLLKDMLRRELIDTIRAVHAGRRLSIPGIVAEGIAAHVARDDLFPARNRSAACRRRRHVQPAHRRAHVHFRADRQSAHEEHPVQAGCARPHPCGDPGAAARDPRPGRSGCRRRRSVVVSGGMHAVLDLTADPLAFPRPGGEADIALPWSLAALARRVGLAFPPREAVLEASIAEVEDALMPHVPRCAHGARTRSKSPAPPVPPSSRWRPARRRAKPRWMKSNACSTGSPVSRPGGLRPRAAGGRALRWPCWCCAKPRITSVTQCSGRCNNRSLQ